MIRPPLRWTNHRIEPANKITLRNVKPPVWRCIAGRRACPPEDCGGPWGYADILEALADPAHERHTELTEWLGGEFDPDAFDAEEMTELMRVPRFSGW